MPWCTCLDAEAPERLHPPGGASRCHLNRQCPRGLINQRDRIAVLRRSRQAVSKELHWLPFTFAVAIAIDLHGDTIVLAERRIDARYRGGSSPDRHQIRDAVIKHPAPPKLNDDRIVAATSSHRRRVFHPDDQEATTIELRRSGIPEEIVAVCLE